MTVAEGDNERGLLFGDVARACAQNAFDPIESVCKETRLYIFIYIDFFFNRVGGKHRMVGVFL